MTNLTELADTAIQVASAKGRFYGSATAKIGANEITARAEMKQRVASTRKDHYAVTFYLNGKRTSRARAEEACDGRR